MNRARSVLAETQKLRRLATISLQNFSDINGLNEKEFWKLIQREAPMVDSWGSPYRLAKRQRDGKIEAYWVSAGPDLAVGTPDDVQVKVPFREGPPLNLSWPESDSDPTVLNAR